MCLCALHTVYGPAHTPHTHHTHATHTPCTHHTQATHTPHAHIMHMPRTAQPMRPLQRVQTAGSYIVTNFFLRGKMPYHVECFKVSCGADNERILSNNVSLNTKC